MKLFRGTRANGAEEIEAPGGEFSHLCWQLLEKHQYYCFFFFDEANVHPQHGEQIGLCFQFVCFALSAHGDGTKRSPVYYSTVVWLY